MSLNTPFDKAVYPNTTDLSGDLATTRGTDPNSEGNSGPAALANFWPDAKQPLPEGGGLSIEESANSVSGLPARPARFGPSETPPEPPSLQDRSPGTVDKK